MNNNLIKELEELFLFNQNNRIELKLKKQNDIRNFDKEDNYLLGFYKGQALAYSHLLEILNNKSEIKNI